MRRVALLGLGTMGASMAANWLAKGFDLMVWNRTRAKAQALSRFRLVNQRIGFLRFAAAVYSQGVWDGGEVSGYGER